MPEPTTKSGKPKYKTMRRAIRLKPDPAGLGFILESKGGDISLKYFSARETRRGVTAAPWNSRRLYADTFIRSGWKWSSRRIVLHGHVYRRVGAARRPLVKIKSGLFIPKEMLQGASLEVFNRVVKTDLVTRLGHELGRLLPK